MQVWKFGIATLQMFMALILDLDLPSCIENQPFSDPVAQLSEKNASIYRSQCLDFMIVHERRKSRATLHALVPLMGCCLKVPPVKEQELQERRAEEQR